VVGDGVEAGATSGPAPARGLKNPRLVRIRQEKAVVIAGGARRKRRAALPIGLHQGRDNFERLAGAAATFESEPHKIHADQTQLLLDGLPGEDGLVSNRDSMLVHALLESENPPR